MSSAALLRQPLEDAPESLDDPCWIAYPDSIAEVQVLHEGWCGWSPRRGIEHPVRIRDLTSGDEFFVDHRDLYSDPIAAALRAVDLAGKAPSL